MMETPSVAGYGPCITLDDQFYQVSGEIGETVTFNVKCKITAKNKSLNGGYTSLDITEISNPSSNLSIKNEADKSLDKLGGV